MILYYFAELAAGPYPLIALRRRYGTQVSTSNMSVTMSSGRSDRKLRKTTFITCIHANKVETVTQI